MSRSLHFSHLLRQSTVPMKDLQDIPNIGFSIMVDKGGQANPFLQQPSAWRIPFIKLSNALSPSCSGDADNKIIITGRAQYSFQNNLGYELNRIHLGHGNLLGLGPAISMSENPHALEYNQICHVSIIQILL